MTDSIYPAIKSEQEFRAMINMNLNSERAHKIVEKINALQQQYEHYKKVEKRWKKLGKIVRIVNLIISGSIAGAVGMLAIVTTQGIAIPPLVIAILSGYSAVETSVMEGMNIGIIKKKKNKFAQKCIIIQDYINKMYFYYEKARQDGVITVDELEGFEKIYRNFVNALNNNLLNIENHEKLDMAILMKEAEQEAKNELAVELREKLKHEAIQKLRSIVVS
jgi:hypothetical protein